MIVREIHFPTLYRVVSLDYGLAKYHRNAVTTILRDALDNAVILVDSHDVIVEEISAEVESWSPLARKQVQEILSQMKKRNRLVAVDIGEPDSECSTQGCAFASALAKTEKHEGAICADQCLCRPQCVQQGAFTAADYPDSILAKKIKDNREVILEDGNSEILLEQRVGEPLFRHAKHVKVLDRHIGRHIEKEGGLHWRFKRGLEWLLGQYVTHSTKKTPNGTFEVITGLKSNPSKKSPALGALVSFCENLQQTYDWPVTVTVKNESGPLGELPHARYIFTDQIAVSVDPGIDMFTSPGKTKKLVFTVVSEKVRGAEEKQANKLPTIGKQTLAA